MRTTITYILLFFTVAFSLSSCISSEETNYLQAIETSYSFRAYEEYRIKPNDVIALSLSSQSENTASAFRGLMTEQGGSRLVKNVEVYEDGFIEIPHFGKIKVEGMTLQQAEEATQKHMQSFFKDAQVQMDITNNYFYILSKDKQGRYIVYKDNMTIYQALSISEQTTEKMDLTRVSIIRKDKNGNSVEKTFDLRSADVIQSEFYYIQPNDVIHFPTNRNSFFSITSIGSFLSTITAPLAVLLYAISL